ncbi:hypothetical protein ACFX14_027630 [Malus domestica]
MGHPLFQICLHSSHATSALDEAQNSRRQAQKSERHLLYPDVSASITCTLSFVEITGNLSKISGEVVEST